MFKKTYLHIIIIVLLATLFFQGNSTKATQDSTVTDSYLSKYAYNITTGNFPILTAGRRTEKTTDREILALGDSHGWGQGAADCDLGTFFSSHMAFPYSNGFYKRLEEHINQKYGFYDIIPKDAINLLSGTMKPQTSYSLQSPEDSNFYNPDARNLKDDLIYGYNVFRQKFDATFYIFENTKFSIDMKHPATKMYLGVIKSQNGGKIKVYFTDHNTKANAFYVNPNGYPKVYRVVNGDYALLQSPEIEISGGDIIIDTYSATEKDVVYCIDWGQKQQGQLFFENTSITLLRGIFFDRNVFLNHSMGGHTVGQWMGDSASYNDPARDHIGDIEKYLCHTPYLTIIQAPIANEYLNQTPLATFTSNLDTLIQRLNDHRNAYPGTKAMDVLFLTTIGGKDVEFEYTKSLKITYDDYFKTLKAYCASNNYGFVDFRAWAKNEVNKNGLDYEMLYDDNLHPSPFFNEFIAKELIKIIDLIM